MTTIVVTPPEGSNVLTELRRCLQALGSHGINAKGLVPGGRECGLIWQGYCDQHRIEWTRSRAYHKNDQAWVEQKNGAVVRRLAGYGRLSGLGAAGAVQRLYESARLYVNFFQPRVLLVSKEWVGGKVRKRYDVATTPYQRVLDSPQVADEVKAALRQLYLTLNPVALLRQIHRAQETLWQLAVGVGSAEQPAQAVS